MVDPDGNAAEEGGRSEYFKEYYADNRQSINDKRKQRYHEDPKYRERVLASSRKYRDRNRVTPKIRLPRFSQPQVEETGGGGEIQLFSVGAFAQYLNRSVQAISHWEKNGVLPQTPYRDSRGHRFYTTNMMHVVKEVVGDRRRLFPVEGIRERIEAGWKELGVPVGAKSMKAALARTVTGDEAEAS